MILVSSVFILALLGCVCSQQTLSKGDREFIGYVPLANTERKQPTSGFGVLGDGFEVHALRGDPSFQRNCTVYADRDDLSRVSKAWVPLCYENKFTWWNSIAVHRYLRKVLIEDGQTVLPDETLRLAAVSGGLVTIPEGLLRETGGLAGVSVECFEKEGDIPDLQADYDNGIWKQNTRGVKSTTNSCPNISK